MTIYLYRFEGTFNDAGFYEVEGPNEPFAWTVFAQVNHGPGFGCADAGTVENLTWKPDCYYHGTAGEWVAGVDKIEVR